MSELTQVKTPMNIHKDKRQKGFATLVICLVLIVASTLSAFSVTRTSKVSQQASFNDARAKETHHVAGAALNYGIAWLTDNNASWTASGAIETASPTAAMPTITGDNGDTFTSTITYQRTTTDPDFMLVTATVSPVSEANATVTVQQYVYSNDLLNNPGLTDKPLMIDGCLDNVTGTPDIYPDGYDGGSGLGPFGVAIETSQPATVGGSDCIELGHLDIHGGTIENDGFTPGNLWDELFAISRTEMKAIADAEVAAGVADADRTVVWVTSTSNYHTSWGSAASPVILVFDSAASCPKINGNPTYYGIIFIDSDCDTTNGWGGTEVYGTVAISGDVSKITANSAIYDFGEVSGGVTTGLKFDTITRIPGTWRDY